MSDRGLMLLHAGKKLFDLHLQAAGVSSVCYGPLRLDLNNLRLKNTQMLHYSKPKRFKMSKINNRMFEMLFVGTV